MARTLAEVEADIAHVKAVTLPNLWRERNAIRGTGIMRAVDANLAYQKLLWWKEDGSRGEGLLLFQHQPPGHLEIVEYVYQDTSTQYDDDVIFTMLDETDVGAVLFNEVQYHWYEEEGWYVSDDGERIQFRSVEFEDP
jgi:PAS domain-containing protein